MSEATATANEVKIEDIGPARKRLTITVPAATVDEKLENSLGTLANETQLPGFRKGRAPRELLERRFGAALRGETKNQIVADAYTTAIEEHKIKPVTDPEPDESLQELELKPGQPLTFSVEVEVVPDFEVPSLQGIEIKKPILEVDEEVIERELTRQKHVNGTPHRIERDFEEGDRLTGTAVVTKVGEDEPFFRSNEVLIIIPSDEDEGRGQVLGLMIDGLTAMLKGKKLGDTIEIETTGPEAHEREDIRGAKIVIAYTISHADRVEPATTEEIMELYGLPSEEILYEQLQLALEQRRDQEQAGVMREQVYEHLIKTVDFALPEKLSEMQAARTLERHRMELLYRGVSPDIIESRLAEMREASAESARNRLKLTFILHKLAEELGVEVSQQEINGRIASIAASRGERPEKLRAELVESGQVGHLAAQVREHKTADRIIDQAKIVEVSAEEWQAMTEKAAPAAKKKTTKKKTSKKK